MQTPFNEFTDGMNESIDQMNEFIDGMNECINQMNKYEEYPKWLRLVWTYDLERILEACCGRLDRWLVVKVAE